MQPATTDCQKWDQQRKRDNKFDNIGRLLRVVTPVLHPVTALAIVVMSAGWPRVTVLQVQPPVEVPAFIVIMAMQFSTISPASSAPVKGRESFAPPVELLL